MRTKIKELLIKFWKGFKELSKACPPETKW